MKKSFVSLLTIAAITFGMVSCNSSKKQDAAEQSIESIDEQFETIVQDKGNRPWYKKIWAKNNETGQHCSYFLDNADSLKPRISLSSEIKVNDDGTFESNDLYLYCKKILPEIRNIIERAQ